jgi:MerR family transcriptional regulator, light-induced transcriptional regulator
MNSFTIRDMENLCGIKAHTLRIWEQRYQLHNPKRRAGNHRFYDNDDLKYLLRIAHLYHKGYKISVLAKLSHEEICQLALSLSGTGGAAEIFVNQLTEASLDFDGELFEEMLDRITRQWGFEKMITQVAYPFLQRIGLLWMTGNVVPAQEHFASALICQKIQVAINDLPPPIAPMPGEPGDPVSYDDGRKKVLIFAPKGELHEIPLLYMRYLMKKKGTPTVYFGKDIELEELQYYCRQKPVTHLYFHLVTNLLSDEPDGYLKKLTHLFPDKQIVVSGRLGAELREVPSHTRVLKGLEEMEAFAGEA